MVIRTEAAAIKLILSAFLIPPFPLVSTSAKANMAFPITFFYCPATPASEPPGK